MLTVCFLLINMTTLSQWWIGESLCVVCVCVCCVCVLIKRETDRDRDKETERQRQSFWYSNALLLDCVFGRFMEL